MSIGSHPPKAFLSDIGSNLPIHAEDVEDLKRGSSAELRAKDYFEITSFVILADGLLFENVVGEGTDRRITAARL